MTLNHNCIYIYILSRNCKSTPNLKMAANNLNLPGLIMRCRNWITGYLSKYLGKKSIKDLVYLLSICRSLHDPDVMIFLDTTHVDECGPGPCGMISVLSALSRRIPSSPWIDRIQMTKCKNIKLVDFYMNIVNMDRILKIMENGAQCHFQNVLQSFEYGVTEIKGFPHLRSLNPR